MEKCGLAKVGISRAPKILVLIYNNITHCHVLLAWVGGGDTRGEAGTYFTRYIMFILYGTQKSLLYYSTDIT